MSRMAILGIVGKILDCPECGEDHSEVLFDQHGESAEAASFRGFCPKTNASLFVSLMRSAVQGGDKVQEAAKEAQTSAAVPMSSYDDCPNPNCDCDCAFCPPNDQGPFCEEPEKAPEEDDKPW